MALPDRKTSPSAPVHWLKITLESERHTTLKESVLSSPVTGRRRRRVEMRISVLWQRHSNIIQKEPVIHKGHRLLSPVILLQKGFLFQLNISADDT